MDKKELATKILERAEKMISQEFYRNMEIVSVSFKEQKYATFKEESVQVRIGDTSLLISIMEDNK